MVNLKNIDHYLQTVPPLPETLKACLKELSVKGKEDLVKAADIASKDPALMHYLITLVNKPLFGFKNQVKDARQIFGILGVDRAKQILHTYLISLLSPKKWEIFDMNNHLFQELQSELIFDWNKILDQEHIKLSSAITVLPAAILICEALFAEYKEDFELIKNSEDTTYNDILKNLTGLTLFSITVKICQKWELDSSIIEFMKTLDQLEQGRALHDRNAQLLYLLLFFTFSKSKYIAANLQELIDFNPSYVENIEEKFYKLVGEYETGS